MDTQISIGKVKSVDLKGGYGIIVDDDEATEGPYGSNVYFQIDEVSMIPREGQLVRFVKKMTKAGPRATDVNVLNGGA
jgi:cold shock CspA family protein